MKNKHIGIANITIFGLSILLLIGYGFYMSSQIKGSIRITNPIVVPQIEIPDSATIAYIDFLNNHIHIIADLKDSEHKIDLRLFGYDPETEASKESKVPEPIPNKLEKENKELFFNYTLTLCFASPKNNFCSIDGKLYKEGGLLPDGGKILKIENNRVLILKEKQKAWIYQKTTSLSLRPEDEVINK